MGVEIISQLRDLVGLPPVGFEALEYITSAALVLFLIHEFFSFFKHLLR